MKIKLVYGVGVNDVCKPTKFKAAPEDVSARGRGKYVPCPYYDRWRTMLRRCYSREYQDRYPTYKGCTVCVEWLAFSNFRDWMIAQHWQVEKGEKALHLDKDLLFEGNKVYSPETCVFIEGKVNKFTIDSGNTRGDYWVGCYWDKRANKFKAQCCNLFTGKRDLGYFDTELETHLAWKKQKHLYSCELANSEYVTDERVRQVLLHRYENYTIVEDHLK